ncbi:MAG: hypothetical protein MJY76_07870 [Bacteroidales bacterium]|nr:hypothetical protein [Bacteroidales bacterium]
MEEVGQAQGNGSPVVFTAGISGTKTTINIEGNVAKLCWETTDKVNIEDAEGHKAVYKVSDGAGTSVATLVYESGDILSEPSTYTATLGQAPAQTQTYSASNSVPVYMEAPATTNPKGLVFDAKCGVLKFNFTDASHKVSSIIVSDGTNKYTLKCDPAVSITSAKDFFIAVPAGTYTSLTVYDGKGYVATKTPTLAVAVNHVKPAKSANMGFDIEGVLNGIFTVDNDGTTMRFSKGNLQYQASTKTWRFAATQQTVIGNKAGNTTSDSTSRKSSTSWIDLFRYGTSGYNGKNPYMINATESKYPNASLTSNTDWGRYNAISNGGSNKGLWRTLTSAQWGYILTNTSRTSTRYIKATVNGKACVLLFPDTYTHPSGYPALTNKNKATVKCSATSFTSAQFAEMEKRGVVCLPATGYQNDGETAVIEIGNGWANYWTASKSGANYKPYYFYFQGDQDTDTSMSYQGSDANAAFGFAVRLVTDKK